MDAPRWAGCCVGLPPFPSGGDGGEIFYATAAGGAALVWLQSLTALASPAALSLLPPRVLFLLRVYVPPFQLRPVLFKIYSCPCARLV